MNNKFDERTKVTDNQFLTQIRSRCRSIKQYFYVTLAILSLLTVPAKAAIVLVGGQNYDIELFTTSLSSGLATLASQPWWNNQATASLFAQALGNQLGTPNQVNPAPAYPPYGPFFAYADAQIIGNGYAAVFQSSPPGYNSISFNRTGTFEFATATLVPVPEPTTWIAGALLLLPLARSSIRLLKERARMLRS